MVKKRSIITCIILTFITCGLYGIFWFISLTDDVRIVSGDERLSGGKCFLFTLLTCGIYSLYWAFLIGKAMMQAKSKKGLPVDDNSVLYLVLQIFGLGLVNYCLVQNDLNAFSEQQ